MAAKMKKEIYGYNMAGMPITSKFDDYRGYVIQDHQHSKVTVGRMGRNMFDGYKITSMDMAKMMIDAWEDNDGANNASAISKLLEIAEYTG